MHTLRLIGIYLLAYVCAFAWLWRFVVEAMTGRRAPRSRWPAWEFSPRYVALILQRILHCSIGLVVVVLSLLLIFAMMFSRL